MTQALELLGLAKGTSGDEMTLKSAKIKPIALAVIELFLSEPPPTLIAVTFVYCDYHI